MEIIINKLLAKQDLKYKEFSSKLIPNVAKDKFIGVRTPDIRIIAKEIKDCDYVNIFYQELPHYYQEEYLLHGSLISYEKDLNKVFILLDNFLPFVDNWAVCDMISIKLFKKYPYEVHQKILKWLNSNYVYEMRFAIVTLISNYLDESFNKDDLILLSKINNEDYYLQMALAWYYSFALIKQYDDTIKIFENKQLKKWIHNKALQKAIESYRIDNHKKEYLRSLKC